MKKFVIEKDLEYSHERLVEYYCGDLMANLPIFREDRDGGSIYKTDVDYEVVLRKVRKPRKRKYSKKDQYEKIQNEVIKNNYRNG